MASIQEAIGTVMRIPSPIRVSRLQLVAIIVLGLGSLSIMFRGYQLSTQQEVTDMNENPALQLLRGVKEQEVVLYTNMTNDLSSSSRMHGGQEQEALLYSNVTQESNVVLSNNATGEVAKSNRTHDVEEHAIVVVTATSGLPGVQEQEAIHTDNVTDVKGRYVDITPSPVPVPSTTSPLSAPSTTIPLETYSKLVVDAVATKKTTSRSAVERIQEIQRRHHRISGQKTADPSITLSITESPLSQSPADKIRSTQPPPPIEDQKPLLTVPSITQPLESVPATTVRHPFVFKPKSKSQHPPVATKEASTHYVEASRRRSSRPGSTPWYGRYVDKRDATPPPLTAAQQQIQDEMCYNTRDIGLITNISTSLLSFCDVGAGQPKSASNQTKVTLVEVQGGIKGTIFNDVILDLSNVTIHRPINATAQDGGDHDPRFRFHSKMIYCGCDELYQYARQKTQPLKLWDPILATVPTKFDELSTLCTGSRMHRPPQWTVGDEPMDPTAATPSTVVAVVTYDERVKTVLIARKDDHNPFFQISSALNVWITIQGLGWSGQPLRVIHLDGGYPSPVDELHKRLLSPHLNELVHAGTQLLTKRVHFQGDVLLAPFETTGPMMQHLDDYEPCQKSELIKRFRQESLNVMRVHGIPPFQPNPPVVITIITRKPYSGRIVQRVWLNEDDIVQRMQSTFQKQYPERTILIQSFDFVDFTLDKQMSIMVSSDVVIGMHGAGLVNILWTRPETLIIEIFPKRRKRWGYRNICQFIGCKWYQFRGGKDIRTGRGDNAYDKIIEYEEWSTFFNPLFAARLVKMDKAAYDAV